MASSKYITIKNAAQLSGKSIQTIRRMIKSKKIKFKKDKTPQGFNYLIERDSLFEYFKLDKGIEIKNETPAKEPAAKPIPQETASTEPIKQEEVVATKEETTDMIVPAEAERAHQQIVSYEPVKEFNDTIQKLIEQHGQEKENLFKLVESFQNKVISLENKLKAEHGSSKKWYKLW